MKVQLFRTWQIFTYLLCCFKVVLSEGELLCGAVQSSSFFGHLCWCGRKELLKLNKKNITNIVKSNAVSQKTVVCNHYVLQRQGYTSTWVNEISAIPMLINLKFRALNNLDPTKAVPQEWADFYCQFLLQSRGCNWSSLSNNCCIWKELMRRLPRTMKQKPNLQSLVAKLQMIDSRTCALTFEENMML